MMNMNEQVTNANDAAVTPAGPDLAGAFSKPAPTSQEPVKIDFNQFLQAAPKEFQDLATKNGVKDLETLTKSYAGLNSMLGKKGLVKPAEGAAPEEIEAYTKSLYKEIGVPENGEYEFDLPENLDEKYVDQNFLNELAGVAFKEGVGAKAFQSIIDKVYGAYAKMIEDSGKPADFSELKKEWGNSFDQKFEEAKSVFTKALNQDDPRVKGFNEKFGNDPDAIYAFAKLAEKFGVKEDRLGGAQQPQFDKATLDAQAFEKTGKAIDLYNKGDYKAAEILHAEARRLTEQAAMLK